MRTDGGCDAEVPAGPAEVCSTSHRTLLTVAMWAGPETAAGNAANESPLGTILRRSVAAGVQKPAQEVVFTDLDVMEAQPGSQSLSGGPGLVVFDWSFSFCFGAGASLEVAPGDFEWRFNQQAQRYVAFSAATVRVLIIGDFGMLPAGGGSPSAFPVLRPGADGREEEEVEEFRSASFFVRFWWLFWVLAFFVVLLIMATWMFVLYRRRRLKGETQEGELPEDLMQGPNGAVLRCLPGSFAGSSAKVAHARVTQTFNGQLDVPEDVVLVQEGDIVEVLASGDAWLYGHKLGAPCQPGFFPEGCVAWLGRPVALGDPEPFQTEVVGFPLGPSPTHASPHGWTPPHSPSDVTIGNLAIQVDRRTEGTALQAAHEGEGLPAPPTQPPPRALQEARAANGPLVRVACGFSPAEVQNDSGDLQESCLTLQGGEVVEILAAGAGWLYGRLVSLTDADSNAEGFFPEDRAAWDFEVGIAGPPPGVPNEAVNAGVAPQLAETALAQVAEPKAEAPPEQAAEEGWAQGASATPPEEAVETEEARLIVQQAPPEQHREEAAQPPCNTSAPPCNSRLQPPEEFAVEG